MRSTVGYHCRTGIFEYWTGKLVIGKTLLWSDRPRLTNYYKRIYRSDGDRQTE
jgi:hypothetical protein